MVKEFKWLVIALPIMIMFAFATDTLAQYYGRSYALVIGIDAYPSPKWKELKCAVKDAEDVASFLKTQGFDITFLSNKQATKLDILTTMGRLAHQVKKHDRILFFFAGHGYTETLGGEDFGYIIPYDGTENSVTYISMDTIRTLSHKMGNAKHQLFIINACYGGLLGLRSGGIDETVPNYLKEITRRRARQILTAGGKDQLVVDCGANDHSIFTHHLLEGLSEKKADQNADNCITFFELSSYLVPAASNSYQTPIASELPGHELGEFVFCSPNSPSISLSPTPFEEETRSAKKIVMVPIPAGFFWMGAHDIPGASPLKEVYIDSFQISKFEIINEQYEAFLRHNPDYRKPIYWDKEKFNAPQQPVVGVSWDDAVAYCEWLSEASNQQYRLPTEAEWEKAARGTDGRRFPWGNEGPDKTRALFSQRYGKPKSVGEYPDGENPDYDTMDMAGNVAEWCHDWYEKDYYNRSPTKNPSGPPEPMGPKADPRKVVRGGSWRDGPFFLRCASRVSYPSETRVDHIGFRVVKSSINLNSYAEIIISISGEENDFKDYNEIPARIIYLHLKVKNPIKELWVNWGENGQKPPIMTDMAQFHKKAQEWHIYSIRHRYNSLWEKEINIEVVFENGERYHTTKTITIIRS